MNVLDEDGNLFGAVNLVDALAVMLIFAVLIAGIAVVGILGTDDLSDPVDDADDDLEMRYATIELGHQSAAVVDQMSEGDTVEPSGTPHTLTITDIYVTPNATSNGGSDVTIRAEIVGEPMNAESENAILRYGETSLHAGGSLQVSTDGYAVPGQVTDVDSEGSILETETTPVRFETIVDDRTAAEIKANDTVNRGPHTTARVTTVDQYPIGDEQYRVVVGAELSTRTNGIAPTYSTRAVTVGSPIALQTGSYDLEGVVLQRGSDQPVGRQTTTQAEIELENVSPSAGDTLAPNMTETIRGETLVTITAIETEPAAVILESDDGNIHHRDHPINEDVTLVVDLQTTETDTKTWFHGEALRENESIMLEFDRIVVHGTVTDLE